MSKPAKPRKDSHSLLQRDIDWCKRMARCHSWTEIEADWSLRRLRRIAKRLEGMS